MPIMTLVHVPVAYEAAQKAMEAHPDILAPIMAAVEKYGGSIAGHLIGDGKFVALDVWPSHEAYAGFKAEAGDAIAEWNLKLGVTAPPEDVWEFDPPPAAG